MGILIEPETTYHRTGKEVAISGGLDPYLMELKKMEELTIEKHIAVALEELTHYTFPTTRKPWGMTQPP
ncbi:hypothetical protein CDL15_Pgr012784 [Punica granatum]|uniref:Uncharacterized protein n=1 Tax=Punica granatum TaxID=22663 RepID=A0A218XED9_PUNGR|nr:hypothetical protein CDL15_Pgr012784 [Punica granatum]